MADVTTTEVVYAAAGSGFTVDVTDCNLVADTTIKDFTIVLSDSTFDDLSDWSKLSSTSIQYTGAALNESIIIRRKTPPTALKEASYAERVSSIDWNAEIDRLYRRLVEYEEFNTDYLAGSLGSGLGAILDGSFPTGWNGDISNAPSRNAVFDIVDPINTQQTTNTANISTNTTDIANNLAAITDIQNGYNFTGAVGVDGAFTVTNGGTTSITATDINITASGNMVLTQGNLVSTSSLVGNWTIPDTADQYSLNIGNAFQAVCPDQVGVDNGSVVLGSTIYSPNVNANLEVAADQVLPADTIKTWCGAYPGTTAVNANIVYTIPTTTTTDPVWVSAPSFNPAGSWLMRVGPVLQMINWQILNISGGAFATGTAMGQQGLSAGNTKWRGQVNDRITGGISGAALDYCEVYYDGVGQFIVGITGGTWPNGLFLLCNGVIRGQNPNNYTT